MIKLPTPKYFVLYNGVDYLPDRSELRLSSSFIHEGASQNFEWTATVLNINIGSNEKLLQSCEVLKEYSTFFKEIRINIAAGTEKEKAIKNAVDACISRGGILSDYLLRHKSEVAGMLLTEYNEQETMAMFRRDYEAEIAQAKAEAAEIKAELADAKVKVAAAEAKAAEAKAELAAAKAMIAKLQKNKA